MTGEVEKKLNLAEINDNFEKSKVNDQKYTNDD